LSVERWRDAALRALADGGVAAVAIEPIAKALGVTKGSGYWHFESREALLRAALEEWETKTTDEVIARLARIEDPGERLGALFRQAFDRSIDGRVYLALAAADHLPAVASALRRVSARRLEFVASCYRELGDSEARARNRATVAYAAYLGLLMLRRHGISARDRDAFVEDLIETLV
jgi:AcrR family transcriptional regulator